MLFEVAIIEQPTKEEAEKGAVERLVFGPKAVVARDQQTAALVALTKDDAAKTIDLSKAQVLVRPFA